MVYIIGVSSKTASVLNAYITPLSVDHKFFICLAFILWPINFLANKYSYLFCSILQSERSFQKQPTIFLNRKKGLGAKKRKSLRYIRNVGLGFKTPREVGWILVRRFFCCALILALFPCV